jgi:hypothetical protein
VAATTGYQGYDPFHSIGGINSSSLDNHTILLAAYHLDASRFEFYLSNIFGDGGTAFKSIAIYNGADPTLDSLLVRYDVADSTHNNVGGITLDDVIYPAVEVYYWDVDNPFTDVTSFTIVLEYFTAEETGEDISGVVQWPHLDMGSIGVEKQLDSLDIISTAPEGLTVSVGYDQRDLTARTAPYEIDADTLPGFPIPMPVSGPSFDLKLVFAPGQIWELQAANLYIQ